MKTQPTPEKHQCQERVYGYGKPFRGARCKCNATIEENGIWWCTKHAPSNVKKRNEEWNMRYDAERAAREAKWAEQKAREARRDKLEAAAPKAIAALEDCIKWLSVGQRPQCKAETLEDLIRITAGALAELKGE